MNHPVTAAERRSPVIPAYAWRNPPEPPIGCDRCGAAPGARCKATSGADYRRTGVGVPSAKVHKARAVAVTAWYADHDRTNANVVDFDLARLRLRPRTTPSLTAPR